MKYSILILLLMIVSLYTSAQEEISTPVPPMPEEQLHVFRPDEIVEFAEVDASFPGGMQEMNKWIENNMQYPSISKELGDQGRVYLSFVVETDGSFTRVEVMRGGITEELNREAKRLVRSMPRWTPGEVDGKKVRSRRRIMIEFILPE